MDPLVELQLRVQYQVMDWVGRVVSHEDTEEEITREMRAWVGRDPDRLWTLALASVACTKVLMQEVMAEAGQLAIARNGDWILKKVPGCMRRDPDVVAAVQASIAAWNEDVDMVRDLLVAHRRAGGPPALFGLAMVACSIAASLLTPGGHSVERRGPLP